MSNNIQNNSDGFKLKQKKRAEFEKKKKKLEEELSKKLKKAAAIDSKKVKKIKETKVSSDIDTGTIPSISIFDLKKKETKKKTSFLSILFKTDDKAKLERKRKEEERKSALKSEELKRKLEKEKKKNEKILEQERLKREKILEQEKLKREKRLEQEKKQDNLSKIEDNNKKKETERLNNLKKEELERKKLEEKLNKEEERKKLDQEKLEKKKIEAEHRLILAAEKEEQRKQTAIKKEEEKKIAKAKKEELKKQKEQIRLEKIALKVKKKEEARLLKEEQRKLRQTEKEKTLELAKNEKQAQKEAKEKQLLVEKQERLEEQKKKEEERKQAALEKEEQVKKDFALRRQESVMKKEEEHQEKLQIEIAKTKEREEKLKAKALEEEKKKTEKLLNLEKKKSFFDKIKAFTSKELNSEEKKLDKEKKDADRKEKLRIKFEEEQIKKKEKESKQIIAINEKKEKARKLKEEKEQARRERKEKELKIKQAKAEERAKKAANSKSFSERITEWYSNLSLVKDKKNRRELQRETLLLDVNGADAERSEEKVFYKYVAKNGETGKVEKGYLGAYSKLDVHSFLLAEGYEVYEITPQANFSGNTGIKKGKLKASELDFFLTQLSTLLKAGITLVEAVKILSKQTTKTSVRNLYKAIVYELSMGENFSDALDKQGNTFPRLLINMVKTAEMTGDLPETLDDMASYYKETAETKRQMISAMTYPLVILCFAFIVLIYIMVSVIPQFVSIYDTLDTDLPSITVKIISISNFLQVNWMWVVLGVIGFIILFIVLYKTIKVFKTIVQSLIMNIPIIGKIIIYNEVTMFTKTFASLLNHSVYITDCMEVLGKITDNEVYKMLIFDTITNLAKGDAISNSFKGHWAFPTIAYEMILTGEKTGQLGLMMDKVAIYYQSQHKNMINQIKAFIEPIMIILLAFIVGVVLLSVVLPMFDMYQNIS